MEVISFKCLPQLRSSPGALLFSAHTLQTNPVEQVGGLWPADAAGPAAVDVCCQWLSNGSPRARLWREGPMKAASWSLRAASWSLIVIPEHNPILEKIGMSFKAVLILATAFLVAFLMTVFLFLMYPSLR